jgi:hypothetical protein
MSVKCGLTLKEEHGLRTVEKLALRKIFGPKGDEVHVKGERRRPHNEELYNVYSSPNM